MENNWTLPTINVDRCTGCGLCVTYCPTEAVEWIGSRPAIVRPQDCAYCGTCEDICPEGAIELVYEIVRAPRTRHDEHAKPSCEREA